VTFMEKEKTVIFMLGFEVSVVKKYIYIYVELKLWFEVSCD
jgi:hypothetical protein